MAATSDLELERGDDVTITVTFAGSGSIAGDTYAYYIFASEADANPEGDDALVTKTSGNGIEIISASARTIRITLLAADTQELEGEKDYAHRFRRTNAGFAATLTKGKVTIND